MSLETNKALVLRFFEEGFNQGNLAIVDELVTPDAVAHHAEPGELPGREGWKQTITMYRSSFPDLHYTVEDVVAEGDRVVLRWTATGTDTVGFMGLPPTGRSATVTGINIYRVEDGKLVEHWDDWDMLGLLQQLGIIPTPGQAVA